MVGGRTIGTIAAMAMAVSPSRPGGPAGAQPYGNGQWGYGPRLPRNDGRIWHGPCIPFGGGPFYRPVTEAGRWRLHDDQATSYIRECDRGGEAYFKDNTVTYSGSDVVIDGGGPARSRRSDVRVHGLTNPTLVVPLGAVVHLNLVNMDYGNTIEHGVILTRVPPPYPYFMMATGPGLGEVMPLLPGGALSRSRARSTHHLERRSWLGSPKRIGTSARLRNTPKRTVR